MPGQEKAAGKGAAVRGMYYAIRGRGAEIGGGGKREGETRGKCP